MQGVFKFLILLLLSFNLFIGFKFYNVAIPIDWKTSEGAVIERLASTFKISSEEAKVIYFLGKSKDVDPILVASIAKVESNNNPNAVSPKGYRGRMQSSTAKFRYDSVEVMNGIEEFIEWMKYYKGDVVKALASYNGGFKNPMESYARIVLTTYHKARSQIYVTSL